MGAGKMAQTIRLTNLAVADRSMICNTVSSRRPGSTI